MPESEVRIITRSRLAVRWRAVSCVAFLALACLVAACQPKPEELWAQAEASSAAGDTPAAIIHLKRLLQQQPDNERARAALGRAMLEMGDPVTAEREIGRAIRLRRAALGLEDPGSDEKKNEEAGRKNVEVGGDLADMQLMLVRTLLAQKRFQESLKNLGPAADAQSPDLDSLMLAGTAYEGIGNTAEAEARYRRAMAMAPGQVAPLVATATLLIKNGRATEADPLIDQALRLDAHSIQATVVRGRRMLEAGRATDAAAFFRNALDYATTAQERAEILANLAESQLAAGEVPAASESVRRLEAIAPGDIFTRFLRARVQAQDGDYAGAILTLQRLLNDAPDFTPAERLIGTVHYLNGDIEQAATHISRLIGNDKTDPFLASLLNALRDQQRSADQAPQTGLPRVRQGPGVAYNEGLLLQAGQASLKLGDSASAISYFQKGGQQHPDDERFRLGEISARLLGGDAATARKMLEEMRASSSNPMEVDYLSVLTYLVEGDNARAEALATRLAAENASAPSAHFLLATVHMAAGRMAKAREEFERVLKLDPANKEALLYLAQLDYQDGDRATGEKLVRGLIAASPDDFRPRLLLAEWQFAEGKFDDALEQARQAARLAPDIPAVLYQRGRVAAASGHWDEARESYSRITTLNPRDFHAWLNLARVTVAGGQKTDLPESLRKAIEIAPRDPDVLMTAGDLMMELGRTDGAIQSFENAYAVAPSAELAIRACRARTMAHKPAACELLSSWLAKHPQDMEARLFMALVHWTRDENKEAVAAYEAALRQDPDQPIALANLAWLYFAQGDRRALATAERALKVQPDAAPVKDTLGWIQVHGGDKRRGLDLISSAAKASPGDADIQYHLAFALAENGDADQARKTLAALLAAAPKFPSRGEAEGLMRRLEQQPAGAGG